ncbi:MAG: ATP-dependent helicase/deoxyribonuclease subunit B [Rhodocyclaceae bacterium]|nr:ATP-dependent helicase/deoxyribonuclease subunit B [Rhodocyclaceae bacterium]
MLVQDETGWKLSTTRAAALVDAWLEVIAADAYHRDLLDLVKSPFVFGDLAEASRQAGLLQLEEGLVRHNLAYGLGRFEAVLARQAGCGEAVELLKRMAAAHRPMPRTSATAADWLAGLERALESLGAVDRLAQDAAGVTLLALLRARREELAAVPARLTFGEWREWLNRELENAAFVDRSIDSPVVMTHLAAMRLRRFDAAVLVGADRDNLAPACARSVFGNQAVRAELGLPLPAEAAARLRDDLAGLIVCCGEVTATWQTLRGDEANLPCPELGLLSVLHASAWGDDLVAPHAVPPLAAAANGTPMPRPAAPQRVPLRLSASAYASLMACPYQFFVRRMLGLAQAEEVREALEKRDYGEFVHRILQRFHAAHPQISGRADEVLTAELEAISREVFAPEIEANFLEHAWLARWLDCVPGYIAWQKAREAAGWRHAGGELTREIALPLAGGGSLALHGRLDRIDRRADGAEAVLDYKTQDAQGLKRRLADAGEDVQLACYALLQGERVTEAAYLALDGEKPAELALPDVQGMAREQGERLAAAVAALRAGASLPAHGTQAVCEWCEARGLCRKDYHLAT